MDIAKPDINKYKKLKELEKLSGIYFSKATKKIPIKKENKRNRKSIVFKLLIFLLLLDSFNKEGILPKIKPIKIDFVCNGYVVKK